MRHCFTLILCLYAIVAYTQDKEKEFVRKTVIDTVFLEKNTVLIGSDSTFFIKNDTVIYLTDTIRSELELLLLNEKNAREEDFYKNFSKTDSTSYLRKKIIDLVFGGNPVNKKKKATRTPSRAIDVNGKVVGQIIIQGLDIFGPSVNDTTSDKTNGFSRLANELHFYTRERVIRNRLILQEGDRLTPDLLLDNERLLRELPYIRDARFIVQPANGDTVNLLLVTQDLLAYSGTVRPNGFKGGRFGLNNLNIFGYGHQLYTTLKINTDRERKVGYIGEYRIPNIRGTQMQGIAAYENTEYEQRYSLSVERDFLTPGFKVAGGALVEHRRALAYPPWIDSYDTLYAFENEEDIPRNLFKLVTQDYWIGRSFTPEFVTSKDSRSRLIVAVRYLQKNYVDRPLIVGDFYRAYSNRQLFLMSFGYSKSNFTTERLVYGYGRTEDIPLGKVAEVIFGPERGEFKNRFFTGVRAGRGNYVRPLGYISGGFRIGGYWHNNQLEDGIFQMAVRTFSYPIQWRRTTYRVFFNTDYSQGIKPTPREDFRENFIGLNDRDGIRGMRSYRLYGNQRLTFSLETVAYLPWDFYSFNMAAFFFADVGFIADKTETLIKTPLYQGYGVGFRVRNDRLAFKTFQLRLAAYPVAPQGEAQFKVTIAGIPFPRLMSFSVRKPEAFDFDQ